MSLDCIPGKRTGTFGEKEKTLAKMITDKYRYTVHVDSRSVTQVIPDTKSLREFPLNGAAEGWSLEVLEAVEKLGKTEGSVVTP